jgi:hypothetical protein
MMVGSFAARIGKDQMSNAFRVWNNWFSLASQAAMLPWQTQHVIAFRLMRLAGGGALARSDATRMVTEKEQALGEEQAVAAVGSVTGRNRRHVAKKSMAGRNRRHIAKKVGGVYKKRVRGNRRRLAR